MQSSWREWVASSQRLKRKNWRAVSGLERDLGVICRIGGQSGCERKDEVKDGDVALVSGLGILDSGAYG